jgi:two-component system, NtrC family, sensor kinase
VGLAVTPPDRGVEALASANRRLEGELEEARQKLVTTVDRLAATQARLLQAEKLSALGQLVAGVAHELNNPLTSVIGYAQLLHEELTSKQTGVTRPAEALAEDLGVVCREAERAARIVRALLAFASRQAATREPVSIGDLVEPVLALRQHAHTAAGIEFAVCRPPDLPRLLADAPQLQQVLLNLLLNAEQAVRPVAGPRRIDLAIDVDTRAYAVRFAISENGHGINPADLGRVFDPFFTTRPVGAGSGLGLSVCYGIVRDHGGEIEVESVPFRRTTFVVRLPALPAQPVDRGPVAIVLRDPAAREFLAAALRAWGYRFVAADSGERALAIMGRRIAAALIEPGAIPGALPAMLAALDEAGARLVLLGDHAGLHALPGDAAAACRARARAVVPPPYCLEMLRAGLVAAGVAETEALYEETS